MDEKYNVLTSRVYINFDVIICYFKQTRGLILPIALVSADLSVTLNADADDKS